MAQRVTRHLRLLRQLKCLTAAKTPTVLDYPRNFANAAKDGLKGTTRWAVYYFTNRNSWYPLLERAMILSAIPAIQLLLPLQVTVQSIQKMRDWAKTFVAAVRQRSVTQETTMALAGTLYLYQKEI